MTKPLRLSASAISTWNACPRAWYGAYVEGRRSASTPSQALGTAIHAAIEAWYKGVPIDIGTEAGKRALPLVQYAPPRDRPSHTEYKIEFKHPADPTISFVGYIDKLVQTLGGLALYDWKSTSDEQYAQSADTLAHDVQCNIYAYWAMLQTGQTEVDCVWVYTRTKGAPKAWPVRLTCTREQVDRAMTRIFETASLIKSKRDAMLGPDAYEKKPGNCNAYHKLCQHHVAAGGTCNPQPKLGDQAIELPPEQGTNTTMQNNGQNPVAPSPGLADLLARLQQPAPMQAAPPGQILGLATGGIAPAPGPLASFLLPPEANSPAVQAQPLAAPPLLDATASETPTAVATPRPKRGRPPKAKPDQARPAPRLDALYGQRDADAHSAIMAALDDPAALAEARASIALDRGEVQTFTLPPGLAEHAAMLEQRVGLGQPLAAVSDAQAYAQGYPKAEAPKPAPVLDLAALGRALDAFAKAWLGVTP